MSNKPVGNFRQVMGVPDDGTPWLAIKRDLIESPAWQALSIHGRRLLDFLMVEHLSHASRENGHLKATYGQLVAIGIGRRFIALALEEVTALGLVSVERGGRCARARDHMNVYTLTMFGSKRVGARADYYVEPTNEWRTVTPENVKRVKARLKGLRAKRNAKRSSPFPKIISSGAPVVNQGSAPVVNRDQCTRGELTHGKPRLVTVHHG